MVREVSAYVVVAFLVILICSIGGIVEKTNWKWYLGTLAGVLGAALFYFFVR